MQQFLPSLSTLYDARILIFPLVFLCAAVSVDFASMLLLAFICGFLWDAQNTVSPSTGNPNIYSDPIETLRFGYSIILYAIMGCFMQGIQPLFKKGKWYFTSLLTGLAIFLYLFSEYLLINFVRGNFTFPATTFYQIYLTSALTMLFSPIIFWMIYQLSSACKHEIRYKGLRKKTRFSH